MPDNESIVYVVKDNESRFKCNVEPDYMLKKSLLNGEVKVIYFETFKSSRGAKLRLKKMQSLDRLKLIELIKGSNPEMLNLLNCI